MTSALLDDPTRDSLRPALERAVAELGSTLATAQIDALLCYLALLSQWNRTYNLTAVREPAAMLSQHVIDCLAVVAPLRRQPANGRRVLDVGSGAGLPGVIIAIAAPEFEVTCIDSVGKKAAFVAHVAGALKLSNLASIHARVETMEARPFDVVTSRAFASLSDFVESTMSLVAPGGAWMAMKGKRPDDQLALLDSNRFVFHVEPIVVPSLDAQRCIAWIRRSGDSAHMLTSAIP